MGKEYTGYRLDGKNVVQVNGEDLVFPRISVAYALSDGKFDWGEPDEWGEDVARALKNKKWSKWGRVLETARILLSNYFGDFLSDMTLRRGRYQAVRLFRAFADEILRHAGDTWVITDEEIKAWIDAKKNGLDYRPIISYDTVSEKIEDPTLPVITLEEAEKLMGKYVEGNAPTPISLAPDQDVLDSDSGVFQSLEERGIKVVFNEEDLKKYVGGSFDPNLIREAIASTRLDGETYVMDVYDTLYIGDEAYSPDLTTEELEALRGKVLEFPAPELREGENTLHEWKKNEVVKAEPQEPMEKFKDESPVKRGRGRPKKGTSVS